MGFTSADLVDQKGRTFVITGANSGIGLAAARALARVGARVVIASRDAGRAAAALDQIRAESPRAEVETASLDLASLASVRACAGELRARFSKIDVLVNNAGIMAIPRRETADGFEMQFGTNHLGHFALTGLLLDRITDRVVNVSSTMHRRGKMRFDDLQGQKSYAKWGAYGQSKLANLLFTYELKRRLAQAGSPVKSVACHPGYASTNLQGVGPQMESSSLMLRVTNLGNRLIAQSAEGGAWPTLYAATGADVNSGDYIGPGGLFELKGPAVKVGSNAASHHEADAARLWSISEELTGVRYLFRAAA
jgi:NAD(P)-dependent dehydrogenase (short-subunit alcohol dehydrogenase family)